MQGRKKNVRGLKKNVLGVKHVAGLKKVLGLKICCPSSKLVLTRHESLSLQENKHPIVGPKQGTQCRQMKEKNVRVRITHMSLSSSFVCARLWWRSQNGSSSKSARWGDILGPCKNKMCDFVLRSCMCFPFCELERDGKCICPKRRGCCCLL